MKYAKFPGNNAGFAVHVLNNTFFANGCANRASIANGHAVQFDLPITAAEQQIIADVLARFEGEQCEVLPPPFNAFNPLPQRDRNSRPVPSEMRPRSSVTRQWRLYG